MRGSTARGYVAAQIRVVCCLIANRDAFQETLKGPFPTGVGSSGDVRALLGGVRKY